MGRLTVEVPCTRCQELCFVRKSHVSRFPNRNHFCSVACHNKWQGETWARRCGIKICGKCGEARQITEFDATAPYKLRGICKICRPPADKEGKVCTECGRYKLFDEFYRRSCVSDGFNPKCKDCVKVYDPRTLSRIRQRFRKYGITKEEYNRLLSDQQGVCAVCRQPESQMFNGKLRELSIDHSHLTGQVRGLLCQTCNSGIGMMKESTEILRKAIEYLEKQ